MLIGIIVDGPEMTWASRRTESPNRALEANAIRPGIARHCPVGPLSPHALATIGELVVYMCLQRDIGSGTYWSLDLATRVGYLTCTVASLGAQALLRLSAEERHCYQLRSDPSSHVISHPLPQRLSSHPEEI